MKTGQTLNSFARRARNKIENVLAKKRFQRLWAPIADKSVIQLGTDYGGWHVPLGSIGEGALICAGAGEDISFDVALAARLKRLVYVVDPTPRAAKHFQDLTAAVHAGGRFPINNGDEFYQLDCDDLDLLSYHKIGLWSERKTMKFFAPRNQAHVSHSIVNLQGTTDYFTADCLSLAQFMKSVGGGPVALLKLDIEGAEVEVLNQMLDDNILPTILCVEFDCFRPPLGKAADRAATELINRLERHYACAHLTDLYEVTLVRRRAGQLM